MSNRLHSQCHEHKGGAVHHLRSMGNHRLESILVVGTSPSSSGLVADLLLPTFFDVKTRLSFVYVGMS